MSALVLAVNTAALEALTIAGWRTLSRRVERARRYGGNARVNHAIPRRNALEAESRPAPMGWVVLHAAGTGSWLRTKYGRDECATLGGIDTQPQDAL